MCSEVGARGGAGGMQGQAESSTFLFSDIEASTRRWENDPDAMAADLAKNVTALLVDGGWQRDEAPGRIKR